MQIIIGDARETVPKVDAVPDVCVLDSAHDARFAEWYLSEVVPAVRGCTIIDDVLFADRREPSTEAQEVLPWLAQKQVSVLAAAFLERDPSFAALRRRIPLRLHYESNAILFGPLIDGAPVEALELSGIENALEEVRAAPRSVRIAELEALERLLRGVPRRPNLHRVYVELADGYRELGMRPESEQSLHQALGSALVDAPSQRQKGLQELAFRLLPRRRARLALVALLALGADRPAVLLRSIGAEFPHVLGILARRGAPRRRLRREARR